MNQKLQPHQARVVAEKSDLDEKLAKLSGFLDSEAVKSLDPEDQSLLHKQRVLMFNYSGILSARIARFTPV